MPPRQKETTRRQALLEGDRAAAREAFTKCVALNRAGVLETGFARVLLKRLEEQTASEDPE
ncbi:MAG: hypothetical protein PVJ57_03480 [Phycisphaerae bacterium]